MSTFKISGEFVTNHGRNLVLEGSWNKALTYIFNSLEGMTYDYVINLLSGKNKLIGMSGTEEGIELIDENPEDVIKYLEDVRYFYGGAYCRVGDDWYRPYAIVTSYGEYDARSVGTIDADNSSRRSLHYADSVHDISSSVVVPGTGTVHCSALFAKVVPPPVWLSVPKTPQEAVDEYLKLGRYLEERGHIKKYSYVENNLKTAVLKIPQWANNEEDEKARCARVEKEIQELKKKIIAKAEKSGGFFDLVVKYPKNKENVYKIPYLPFKAWALGDYDIWDAVCPSGLKMSNDNNFHSDWVVGAGIDIDLLYGYSYKRDDCLSDAIWNKRIAMEKEFNENFIVIRGSGKVIGKIVHPEPDEKMLGNEIIVIPNLRSDYYIPATGSLAIISELGGEMSHLASISNGFNIMRVHDARIKYKIGDTITIDFDNKTIEPS